MASLLTPSTSVFPELNYDKAVDKVLNGPVERVEIDGLQCFQTTIPEVVSKDGIVVLKATFSDQLEPEQLAQSGAWIISSSPAIMATYNEYSDFFEKLCLVTGASGVNNFCGYLPIRKGRAWKVYANGLSDSEILSSVWFIPFK